MTTSPINWPDNKRFAFTVFDDTDSQTLEKCRAVYGLLGNLGFRTTKSVWPVRGTGKPSDCGATCDQPDYREYVQSLQRQGFEIGYHMATSHTSTREETIHGLDQFARHFGHYPVTMANHYFSNEDIYFGDARLTGVNRFAYNLLTRFKNRNRFRGHVEGDPLFWGDLCRERIKYVRNFSFAEINTLKICTQLLDVFDKQKLAPSYGVERVRALIRQLLPTGNLLLVRALAPDGKCIGTGIYPGLNKVAQFWGNASYRATQILRPNETLHWYAMRYWKSRGVERFDWGGGGTYKEKYGPYPLAVPWFGKSKYRLLGTLRNQALNLFRMRQRLVGRLRAKKAPAAENEEE